MPISIRRTRKTRLFRRLPVCQRRSSERRIVKATTSMRATTSSRMRENNVSLFANYGEVVARLPNAAPSYYVPNVPLYTSNIGIDYSVAMRNAERLSGSAFVSFIGHQNMTQDGALTAGS